MVAVKYFDQKNFVDLILKISSLSTKYGLVEQHSFNTIIMFSKYWKRKKKQTSVCYSNISAADWSTYMTINNDFNIDKFLMVFGTDKSSFYVYPEPNRVKIFNQLTNV